MITVVTESGIHIFVVLEDGTWACVDVDREDEK